MIFKSDNNNNKGVDHYLNKLIIKCTDDFFLILQDGG